MSKYLELLENGDVVFSHFQRHQNPWRYVAEKLQLSVDMAQQGSHVNYDVAVINMRHASGEREQAIIGDLDAVDDMIKALQLVKKQLELKKLQSNLASTTREIEVLERAISGTLD